MIKFVSPRVLFASLIVACGSSPSPAPTTSDAGDFGAPSDTYPAWMPSVPQAVTRGGPVLATSMRVVPVFFAGDSRKDEMLAFLPKFASSAAWKQLAKEYGTATPTIAAPIEIAMQPPAAVSDDDVQTFLKASLDGSHAEWGPTDAEAIATSLYVLYYPQATTLAFSDGSRSCKEFAAYHTNVAPAKGGIGYAVVARCPNEPAATILTATSHELVEAATDPLQVGNPAYTDVDAAHAAWSILYGGPGNFEVSDACTAIDGTDFFVPPDVGAPIARWWSNAAMRGFHDPCVPAKPNAVPYFAALLPDDEDVGLDVGLAHIATKGINVHVGVPRTVEVRFASDAKTDAWSIFTFEPLQNRGVPRALKTELDVSTGVNGNKAHLTITAMQTTSYGGTIIAMQSTLGGVKREWYEVVGILP